jgi:hypothetical protein
MGKNAKNSYSDKGISKRKIKEILMMKKANRLKNIEGCKNNKK